MVFSSYTFLFFFLPILIILYHLLPMRWRSGRNFILLVFDMLFYFWGGPSYLALMLLSIGVNYLGGLMVSGGRRWAMGCNIVINLGLLMWFKYAMFIGENLQALGLSITVPQIALPIGISFFTFQGMSYVIDVYRGEVPAERNPFLLALYISLFPQLVAGPIVRYSTVARELRDRHESWDNFYSGIIRFCFGLSKKMLLANNLALLADEAFATQSLSTGVAWLGALAYTGQLYFDFSGYSDMAIGLGLMFGFHFEENFNFPYISKTVTEFWRRWHMSLSTWFRDYVYIPLGGNRKGKYRHIFNIFVVWMLTGLWHGAAWNFVLWGVYYGLLLLGEKYLWGDILEHLPSIARHLITMFLVVVGWVIFRCETLSDIGHYLCAMVGLGAEPTGESIYLLQQYGAFLWIGILASLPVTKWLRQLCADREPLVMAGQMGSALILSVLSVIQLISSTSNPFIYFRF